MNATNLAAHHTALQNDRSISVRLAVLKNLGRTLPDFPEITVWLEEMAHDPGKEVREAAAAILEG